MSTLLSARVRVLCIALAITFASRAWSGTVKMNPEQREAASQMLLWLHDTVKSYYYDPNLHGVDLRARYLAAKEKLASINTLSEAYGLSAWLLEPLNDSHTFFVPPMRPYRVEHGWRMGFIGDRCYLTAVEPGSDAANQGLKAGDQVLAMEGFRVERKSAWKLHYAFEVLAPRSGMHLVVAAPNAQPREFLVNARVKKLSPAPGPEFDWWRDPDEILMDKPRVAELGDLTILKLPNFEGDRRELDRTIRQAMASRALILDLRGNGGGLESVLIHLLSTTLERDTIIGQPVSRKTEKPLLVKVDRQGDRFCGKLIVLVDSESASAAEVFAHVIQLEKRGTVLGDRTSGYVMEARTRFGTTSSALFVLPFALELTSADLIMADGKSLEGNGVVPDELVLPTAEDLAAGRDPVLARAAHLAGLELSPEKAGALFPPIWRTLR